MLIRAYRPEDFPVIAEIYGLAKLDELAGESVRFTLIPLECDHRRLTILMASTIYVVEQQGTVGFGAHHGKEITALFIHPAHRGQGLGKLLLEYLLARIGPGARLCVATSNAPAIGLYHAYGFELEDEFLAEYNHIAVPVKNMTCRVACIITAPASGVDVSLPLGKTRE